MKEVVIEKMKRKGTIQLAVAGVCFLASGWNLLWIFSSASLACQFCDCKYDLFHEHFRCRQPVIAEILWIIFGVLFLLFLVLGIRNRRRQVSSTENRH